MTLYSGLTLLANAYSTLIATSGTELTDSRRYIDLSLAERVRCQFKATAGMTVRIDYSTDNGLTWLTLIPSDSYFGGNPFVCDWLPVPVAAQFDNVLVRAIGIGVGILTTVNYVELSFG